MKIKVKAARGGDKFEFDVKNDQPVEELKKQIENASKITPEEQRLIYKGRVLKDEQTMAEISKFFQSPPFCCASSERHCESCSITIYLWYLTEIKENDTILLVRGRKKALPSHTQTPA